MEELFKNACTYVRSTSRSLKSDDLLYFYSRYKQVRETLLVIFSVCKFTLVFLFSQQRLYD